MAAAKISTHDNFSDDSGQTSPAWMVTFVRFSQRSDEYRNPLGVDSLSTREAMPVINDCIDVTVNESKGSLNNSAEITLLSGDIDYQTAVSTGDYFIVNIVDSEEKILDLYKRVRENKAINKYDDGFKGLFKVQSVHQSLAIDGNGIKRVVYKITGYAFSEFNNTIYFNPFLVQEYMKSPLFFLTAVSDKWNLKIKDGNYNSVQNVIMALYDAFMGKSTRNLVGEPLKEGLEKTPIRPYEVPSVVMSLMGRGGKKGNIVDINNVIIGKQSYTSVSNPKEALNLRPNFNSRKGNIFVTNSHIEGHSFAKPEYFNQIKIWDILNQYLNGSINEMYTSFKPDLHSESTSIFPTLTIREKPFTTNKFAKKTKRKTTPFLSLPRWVLNYDNVTSMQIGKDDAARFNFVQIFGRNQTNNPNASISMQTKAGNYVIEKEDIRRSGLRPFVVTIPFDYFEVDSKTVSHTPYWATLIADWLIGGHLKMSGTIQSFGIEKPISVGDNLQIGENVFHIENISHRAAIDSAGVKIFRTTISVSNGVMDDNTSSSVPYLNMEFVSADEARKHSYEKEGEILPGVSDSQDLTPLTDSRHLGEKIKEGDIASFTRSRKKKSNE